MRSAKRGLAGYILLEFFMLGVLLFDVSAACWPQAREGEPDLEIILKNCGNYCEKLSRSVLYFVCEERVKQETWEGGEVAISSLSGYSIVGSTRRKIEKKEFVYDYQLLSRNNSISEVRHLVEEDGKEKREEFTALKGLRFEHKNVIMGPIGVMSNAWQQFHEYRFLKEERFKEEPTWIIEALPKDGNATGQLFGRVWVSQNDFSVVRIEWKQQSIRGYEKLMEDCRKQGLEPFITLVSEYAFKKNGIRFPSLYELTERYSYRGNRKFTASIKAVTYSDYRFFTVETDVKY